jgi:hypothetical protein
MVYEEDTKNCLLLIAQGRGSNFWKNYAHSLATVEVVIALTKPAPIWFIRMVRFLRSPVRQGQYTYDIFLVSLKAFIWISPMLSQIKWSMELLVSQT